MAVSVFNDPQAYPGITLNAPYAGLVRAGLKTLETRKWRIHHRGSLVICAGAARDGAAIARLYRELVPSRMTSAAFDEVCSVGGVLAALVDVVGCRSLREEDAPRSLYLPPLVGDTRLREHRWAWELENIRPLQPRPFKGHQGFIRVPRALVDGARIWTGIR